MNCWAPSRLFTSKTSKRACRGLHVVGLSAAGGASPCATCCKKSYLKLASRSICASPLFIQKTAHLDVVSLKNISDDFGVAARAENQNADHESLIWKDVRSFFSSLRPAQECGSPRVANAKTDQHHQCSGRKPVFALRVFESDRNGGGNRVAAMTE